MPLVCARSSLIFAPPGAVSVSLMTSDPAHASRVLGFRSTNPAPAAHHNFARRAVAKRFAAGARCMAIRQPSAPCNPDTGCSCPDIPGSRLRLPLPGRSAPLAATSAMLQGLSGSLGKIESINPYGRQPYFQKACTTSLTN